MQTNATCVTGISLAHRLPCTSGRVTTQRSAVVTRPHSVPKCEWCGKIFVTRPNAGRITASLLNKKFVFSHDNAVWRAYTGHTFWFYPRPLRQSGTQGTSGSCNRCISESCDPFSTSGRIEAVHLQNQNSHSAVLSSRRPPVLSTSRVPGDGLWPLLCRAHFQSIAGLSCLLQRRCKHTQEPPVCGHVGLRWIFPVPGIPALPLTRHCQVVRGLCPMTVSRKRTCQLRLSGGQKH